MGKGMKCETDLHEDRDALTKDRTSPKWEGLSVLKHTNAVPILEIIPEQHLFLAVCWGQLVASVHPLPTVQPGQMETYHVLMAMNQITCFNLKKTV